jgi:hypothetical protein
MLLGFVNSDSQNWERETSLEETKMCLKPKQKKQKKTIRCLVELDVCALGPFCFFPGQSVESDWGSSLGFEADLPG